MIDELSNPPHKHLTHVPWLRQLHEWETYKNKHWPNYPTIMTFFMVLCKMVRVSGASSTSSAPLLASWYTRSRKRVTPATCHHHHNNTAASSRSRQQQNGVGTRDERRGGGVVRGSICRGAWPSPAPQSGMIYYRHHCTDDVYGIWRFTVRPDRFIHKSYRKKN